jgi:hypothetical protein
MDYQKLPLLQEATLIKRRLSFEFLHDSEKIPASIFRVTTDLSGNVIE